MQQGEPQEQSTRDRYNDKSGIDQASAAQMNASTDQVERAVENVRPWHQYHAGAHHDEPQRRAQLRAYRQSADETCKQRGAERLNEDVRAHSGYGSAEQAARAGAQEDQKRGKL